MKTKKRAWKYIWAKRQKFSVVGYGAGVDSTAMVILLVKLKIRIDYILFSDTGGERKRTYDFIKIFSDWLVSKGYPPIITVRYKTKDGREITLEDDVLANKTLPSIAFGFKSCSQKFKALPIDRWLKHHARWGGKGKPIKYIGFEYGEERRMKPDPSGVFNNRYPLIEHKITREKAKEIIAAEGLPNPGKSSCFYCPNTKRHEILKLTPLQQFRAIAMERNATNVQEIVGLGRYFKWEDLINADKQQLKLFDDIDFDIPLYSTPCECVD